MPFNRIAEELLLDLTVAFAADLSLVEAQRDRRVHAANCHDSTTDVLQALADHRHVHPHGPLYAAAIKSAIATLRAYVDLLPLTASSNSQLLHELHLNPPAEHSPRRIDVN